MSCSSLALLVPKVKRALRFISSEYEDTFILDILIDVFPQVMIDVNKNITVDESGNLSSSIEDDIASLLVLKASSAILYDKASQLSAQAVKIKSGQQSIDISNTASRVRDIIRERKSDYEASLKRYLLKNKGSANSLVLERFRKYDLN
ncbi:hypothetical protein J7M02_00045 [Candidatus Aerophobetes bacterium]|nr:hypothetical protein [Candidatus Aerophobetes bacterium]